MTKMVLTKLITGRRISSSLYFLFLFDRREIYSLFNEEEVYWLDENAHQDGQE